MKMHLLVIAALAGLFSHAAFADPEADFWQQPQPKSFTRPAGLYGTPANPIQLPGPCGSQAARTGSTSLMVKR